MAINKVVYRSQPLIVLTDDSLTDASQLIRSVKAHTRSGLQITGTCDFDVDSTESSKPITAARVLNSYVGFVNGAKVTGSMTNRGSVTATITDASAPYTIQKGYHSGSGSVSVDTTDLVSDNIRKGESILGVTGSFSRYTVSQSVTITGSGTNTLSFSGLSDLGGATPKYVTIYAIADATNGLSCSSSSPHFYVSGWIENSGAFGTISRHLLAYGSKLYYFNGNTSSQVTFSFSVGAGTITINYKSCVFKSGQNYYVHAYA